MIHSRRIFLPLEKKSNTYRRKHGLSVKTLVEELELDPTTLARWERGDVEPRGGLKKRVNSLLKILTERATRVVNFYAQFSRL